MFAEFSSVSQFVSPAHTVGANTCCKVESKGWYGFLSLPKKPIIIVKSVFMKVFVCARVKEREYGE